MNTGGVYPVMKTLEGFDNNQQLDDRFGMRLVLTVVVAFQTFLGFGASWSTPAPDPVGERVYRAHMLQGVIPLAIIVCALLFAWLLARGHKAKKLGPEEDHC